MAIAIKIENLSKQYRLGLVSTRTLSHDLNRWWQTAILGREDPYLKIGQENKLTTQSSQEYVWALRDINLEVEEGEVLGIIGKNGAGKSTLLKILSKVTAPTTGIVKARGRIASLLEVGTGFHSEMTGRENIYMNGAIMGMTKAEIRKKFDEIVDFAGVERYIDTPVKRYSSGMTVRLGFAVAAHLEPEILVVDEVLAVGDAEFQKKAIGKMQEVSRDNGRTVLFVSHNLTSIHSLCSNSILLHCGQKISYGTTTSIINDYLKKIRYDNFSDLDEIKTRKGSGEIKIKKVEFFNSNNDVVNSLISGENVKLKIILTGKPFNLKYLEVDVGINSAYGTRVAWISTSIYKDQFTSSVFSSGNKIIVFDIQKIQLMSGTYNLNILIRYKKDITDWLMNISEFDVIDSDYYKTGRTIPTGQGYFFMDYKIGYENV